MKLQALSLENFRGFPKLAMEFRPDLMILTGPNGAGKSAILDAAALALATYVGGFSDIPVRGISPTDIRMESTDNPMTPYRHTGPVRISARVEVSGHPLAWSRTLENGRTVSTDATEVLQYAAALQEHLRRRSVITLPVVAYYGASRRWLEGRDPSTLQKVWIKNRQSGYLGCLQASPDERMLLSWFENMTYAKQQKLQAAFAPPNPADLIVPDLYAVTQAMAACYKSAFPDVKDVSISFDVVQQDLELTITRPDDHVERLPMRLLGQGIKNTLLLVSDIAYRMAVLNPQFGADVTDLTPGVVLIDEIELHLHPAWQKRILSDLQKIFPLVQFIVTTNAPVVLANTDAKCVRVLRGGQVYRASLQTYSKPVDVILIEVMKTNPQPDTVTEAFSSFYESLEAHEMEAAEQKLGWLTECLGENDRSVERAAQALKHAKELNG